jgi:hypothetical protein
MIESVNGAEIRDEKGIIVTAFDSLAGILVGTSNNELGVMRSLEMARKVYSDKKLDLELSELEKLKSIVENANIIILVKAQLLEVLCKS